MIHLKYKCKVNFVKLPLIWIELCLKLIFENATAGSNTVCRSDVKSRVGNTKTSCNSSRTRTWTALYHLNNAFFFIDAFINITLGCNANAGKYTGISQCLVNSSKHSSGWYFTVRKTSLIFSYSMNWITVTKSVHINHICILCNWKCKWLRERNRRTEMRIRTGLTCIVHCRF